MADHSKIEWTDASFSPIRARNIKTGKVGWHCEHATTGCQFCYAEGMNKRLGTGLPFKPGHRADIDIFLDDDMLLAPLRWKRPRMVFVCSMTDLFADFVKDEWIDKIFAVMALCPQHTFQVLTKRAERMHRYMTEHVKGRAGRATRVDDDGTSHPEWDVAWRMRSVLCDLLPKVGADALNRATEHLGKRYGEDGYDGFMPHWPLPNVWLGVSAEDQPNADERREPLRALAQQGWLTFVSYEPAIGPIDWTGWEFLKWLISGGESGPKARPSHPDWHRCARDWCARNGVAFFFKQFGAWAPGETYPMNAAARDCDAGTIEVQSPTWALAGLGRSAIHMKRVGKKKAGRLLDGVEHNGFPGRD